MMGIGEGPSLCCPGSGRDVMVIATAISERQRFPIRTGHPHGRLHVQTDRDGTVERVIHRLAGTCVGLVIMWAFDVALSPSFGIFLVSLLGATIFVAFIRVNYAVAVTGVTIWIVGVLGAVGDSASTMDLRLLATAMAAVLVLAASLHHLCRTHGLAESIASTDRCSHRYFIHQPGVVVHRWL